MDNVILYLCTYWLSACFQNAFGIIMNHLINCLIYVNKNSCALFYLSTLSLNLVLAFRVGLITLESEHVCLYSLPVVYGNIYLRLEVTCSINDWETITKYFDINDFNENFRFNRAQWPQLIYVSNPT